MIALLLALPLQDLGELLDRADAAWAPFESSVRVERRSGGTDAVRTWTGRLEAGADRALRLAVPGLPSDDLPELDPSCNTMLPAEDRYQVNAPRGPGPSPARGAAAPRPPLPVKEKPTGEAKFSLLYDFDIEWANRAGRTISEIAEYATENKGAEVSIVGYRGATKLSASFSAAGTSAVPRARWCRR